jgi:hypothetical protein
MAGSRYSVLLVVAVSFLALALVAQQPEGAKQGAKKGAKAAKKADEKDRTLGYDDTPFLPDQKWRVHDITRQRPRVVTPGTESSKGRPGRPPSDAIILFDGKDLSQWVASLRGGQTGEPKWNVENGYMEVVKGTGDIITRQKFGDCQLHVEWASPAEVANKGQFRGNSGVILMNRYEVQVLDSYENPTYADGQAGAMYGQWPPLVNACRKPGEWQTYDIVFEAPRFDGDKLTKPAFVTVLHNGVLLHNHQQYIGDTPHARVGTYKPHAPEEPLLLQNHGGDKVRYRNVWIRRLTGYDQK